MRRMLVGALIAVSAHGMSGMPAFAQGLAEKPKAPFKVEEPSAPAPDETDTWIFSGLLQGSRETFSGTLITGKASSQFELKLANGATCDGGNLVPGTQLVRLSDITCSDSRVLRALFVPQGGEALKVFGHVGEERFTTLAHLLGTKPIPEKGQTAEPQAPSPGGTPRPKAPTGSRPAPG